MWGPLGDIMWNDPYKSFHGLHFGAPGNISVSGSENVYFPILSFGNISSHLEKKRITNLVFEDIQIMKKKTELNSSIIVVFNSIDHSVPSTATPFI